MARHRNVRTMNYDEEYDGYDDVYGHSVEDDYASSPSMQHFLYDRNQSQHQMSAYMSNQIPSEIPEEDEIIDEETSSTRRDSGAPPRVPPLGELEQAQLYSCLDLLRDRMGDALSEQAAIDAILASNFDAEKALDQLLKRSVPETLISAPKTCAREVFRPPTQVNSCNGARIAPEKMPVKVVPSQSKRISTGFSLPPTTPVPESNQAKQALAVEETSRQMGTTHLRTPTPRSMSPSEREATPKATSSRYRENKVDAATEYAKERSGSKALLNLVVVGHVDAGKSTLMGHLLYRLGQVSAKQMHKYEQESKKLGKQSFMYAWVLDETGEERSRGITMDVGQSQFETESKAVTLLDAPGHRDFIPNMIFGTAQADVAILVVDATTGEFETGFESGGQTREHALLVRSLGVSQLGVVINKLDMVGWSRDRFNEISARLGTFLRQAGYKEQDIFYVPVSGLTGENLTTQPTEPKLSQWYTGPTLLQAIDGFRSPERSLNRPVRLVISDIFKSTGSSSGCCLAGRIESGMIQSGDKLLVMPLNEITHVKMITINEIAVGSCFAGDQVVLTITGPDPSGISIGSVLCDPNQPIRATLKIEARIVVFNVDVPITKGYPVIVHYQSLSEAATVSKLIAQIHKSSGEIVKKRPRCLTKQTSGLVEIELSRPVCMELYKDYRELGRFMLRMGGSTIAAGLVTKIW